MFRLRWWWWFCVRDCGIFWTRIWCRKDMRTKAILGGAWCCLGEEEGVC